MKVETDIFLDPPVKSILLFPIFHSRILYGLIGFDDVKETTKWHEKDIETIRTCADLFGRVFALNELMSHDFVFHLLIGFIRATIRITGYQIVLLEGREKAHHYKFSHEAEI